MTGKIIFGSNGKPNRYFVDRQEVCEADFYLAFPERAMASGGQCALSYTSPHVSEALGVHRDQVAEATESAKRRGVPTDFLPDGRPIMRSREHQKQYLKQYGFKNRDGGYGD